jgi:hypothetical protein
MKSTMQYLIWLSILEQMQKAGDTKSQYYNMVFAKVKQNEPRKNA